MMNKRVYIKPESEWFYMGLQEGYASDITDSTTGGVESDLGRQNNVWSDDESDSSTPVASKNIWDNEW